MFEFCMTQSPFCGEIEADESYFGAKRIRGKRGRGAGGKTIVFGLLKRGVEVDPISIFTPMDGEAMTAWLTSVLISTLG